jgi:hypothetical protein
LGPLGRGYVLDVFWTPIKFNWSKKKSNMNLEDLVVQPMFISNMYKVVMSSKKTLKSTKEENMMTLDKFNNLLQDIESMQYTMIQFYKIIEEYTILWSNMF